MRYLANNEGANVRVVGYESRPMLKITPPETATDKRVKNFTYIEAITKLPTCFTAAELKPILAKAKVHFKSRMRSTFVVLNDDDLSPPFAPVVPPEDAPGQGDGEGGQPEEVQVQVPRDISASASNRRKRGQPDSSGSESQRVRR